LESKYLVYLGLGSGWGYLFLNSDRTQGMLSVIIAVMVVIAYMSFEKNFRDSKNKSGSKDVVGFTGWTKR
jgi:hypothetical protein